MRSGGWGPSVVTLVRSAVTGRVGDSWLRFGVSMLRRRRPCGTWACMQGATKPLVVTLDTTTKIHRDARDAAAEDVPGQAPARTSAPPTANPRTGFPTRRCQLRREPGGPARYRGPGTLTPTQNSRGPRLPTDGDEAAAASRFGTLAASGLRGAHRAGNASPSKLRRGAPPGSGSRGELWGLGPRG